MPTYVGRRGKLWRLLEPDGSIATTASGAARDGGGHRDAAKAHRQNRALNDALDMKHGGGKGRRR